MALNIKELLALGNTAELVEALQNDRYVSEDDVVMLQSLDAAWLTTRKNKFTTSAGEEIEREQTTWMGMKFVNGKYRAVAMADVAFDGVPAWETGAGKLCLNYNTPEGRAYSKVFRNPEEGYAVLVAIATLLTKTRGENVLAAWDKSPARTISTATNIDTTSI